MLKNLWTSPPCEMLWWNGPPPLTLTERLDWIMHQLPEHVTLAPKSFHQLVRNHRNIDRIHRQYADILVSATKNA
jgi:hypothetical protein